MPFFNTQYNLYDTSFLKNQYLGGIIMNFEEMSVQEMALELLRNKQFVKLKEMLNTMNPVGTVKR